MGFLSNLFDKIKPYQPKGNLYKLLYNLSDFIVKDIGVVKHEKALIEGVLLFTAYCKLATRNEGFIATDILKPLVNETLDHIKHSGLLNYDRDKNISFVTSRIELNKQELSELLFDNERNTHILGYAPFNLLENPLTASPERSADLFKHIELLPKLSFSFKEIDEFLLKHHHVKVDFDNNENDTAYTHVCPMCGGHYELTELTKVSFVDYDMGPLTAYTCGYCTNKLSQTDETFKLEQ
jgi:hypothetical protein